MLWCLQAGSPPSNKELLPSHHISKVCTGHCYPAPSPSSSFAPLRQCLLFHLLSALTCSFPYTPQAGPMQVPLQPRSTPHAAPTEPALSPTLPSGYRAPQRPPAAFAQPPSTSLPCNRLPPLATPSTPVPDSATPPTPPLPLGPPTEPPAPPAHPQAPQPLPSRAPADAGAASPRPPPPPRRRSKRRGAAGGGPAAAGARPAAARVNGGASGHMTAARHGPARRRAARCRRRRTREVSAATRVRRLRAPCRPPRSAVCGVAVTGSLRSRKLSCAPRRPARREGESAAPGLRVRAGSGGRRRKSKTNRLAVKLLRSYSPRRQAGRGDEDAALSGGAGQTPAREVCHPADE